MTTVTTHGSICTKVLPATDTQGTRIAAVSSSCIRIVIPYDYADPDAAHETAARACLAKLNALRGADGWDTFELGDALLLPPFSAFAYAFILR